MPEVILPCPACGSKSIEIDWDNGVHFMKCERCGVSGPCFIDEYPREFVADAWNALPRSLRWTHEPPKVAGWYHWRSGKGQYMTMIQIHEYTRATFLGEPCNPNETVIGYWNNNDTFNTDLARGEWAGPIAPPVEEQCKS